MDRLGSLQLSLQYDKTARRDGAMRFHDMGVAGGREDRRAAVFGSAGTARGEGGRDCSIISVACTGLIDGRWIRETHSRCHGIPFRDLEERTLIGGSFTHIGVAIGAEHVHGAGLLVRVGALARHQHDAGLHLVADMQGHANLCTVIPYPNPTPPTKAPPAAVPRL